MSTSIVKNVVSFATSLGAATIVASFVKAGVPVSGNFLVRASVKLGAFALAQTIGDTAADHFNKQIDETAEAIVGLKAEIKKTADQLRKEDPDASES